MTLTLIRHAQADARGPKYPDDSTRPLIQKGHKQAKALAKALERLDTRFDRLFSSPYTRALETAEPLTGRLEADNVEILTELTTPSYPQLVTQLVDNLEPPVDNAKRFAPNGVHVALVGHEPYLSELTSYLLTGILTGDTERRPGPRTDSVHVKFKKAMVVQLEGPLEAGAMTLQMALPARVYKKLQRT